LGRRKEDKAIKEMEMEVHEKHIKFCQAVGRLAREYGLSGLTGSFQDYDLKDSDIKRVTFNWTQGRHGIDKGNIEVHAEVWLHTRVDEDPKKIKL